MMMYGSDFAQLTLARRQIRIYEDMSVVPEGKQCWVSTISYCRIAFAAMRSHGELCGACSASIGSSVVSVFDQSPLCCSMYQ